MRLFQVPLLLSSSLFLVHCTGDYPLAEETRSDQSAETIRCTMSRLAAGTPIETVEESFDLTFDGSGRSQSLAAFSTYYNYSYKTDLSKIRISVNESSSAQTQVLETSCEIPEGATTESEPISFCETTIAIPGITSEDGLLEEGTIEAVDAFEFQCIRTGNLVQCSMTRLEGIPSGPASIIAEVPMEQNELFDSQFAQSEASLALRDGDYSLSLLWEDGFLLTTIEENLIVTDEVGSIECEEDEMRDSECTDVLEDFAIPGDFDSELVPLARVTCELVATSSDGLLPE